MNLPTFQDFLEYAQGRKDTLDYDTNRFCSQRLKTPGNPFSTEEFTILTDTCVATSLAFLAQYHQWLMDQINEWSK